MAIESSVVRIRWRLLASRVLVLAIPIVGVAALIAANFLMPFVRPEIRRNATELFLRGLLIGYSAGLGLALVGIITLPAVLLSARRRGVRRPRMARLLLLCSSFLVSLVGLEAASCLWMAWSHRLPVLPTRFPPAPADEISIVALGGSSGLGYPYNPACSPAQIIAWQLERALPGRRVVVDNRSKMGASLEMEHQGLVHLDRRPDVMLIYAANNEFLARYEGSRDAALDEAPLEPILNRFYRLSQHSWLCGLLYETVSKNRLGGPPPALKKHRVIDPPLCTPSEYEAIRSDFERRLEALVAYCLRVGAVPVLMIPPGNESGFEPTRSAVPQSVSKAEREKLIAAFESARGLESEDPLRSVEAYRGLVERQPEFAEAQFRFARLLEEAGDTAGARRHYIRARDFDVFPVRCTTTFQNAFRAVAARHNCILIDGPEVTRAKTPKGIIDDHVIHDAHHPTLMGQIALAEAVLAALRKRQELGWSTGDAPTLDPAECVRHFKINREVWQAVCARSSTFYRDFSHARYDPSERLAKMRKFAEAGRQIGDGMAPEQTGVPGLGIAPVD